jgi:O-antigen/teichoic acid export membrane protein
LLLNFITRFYIKSKTIGSFAIYSLGGIATKAIAFFLLPVFTYYLLPADYGMISLISSATLAVTPFISLGITDIITVEYKKMASKEYYLFQASSVLFPIVLCFLALLLTVLFPSFLSKLSTLPLPVIVAIPLLALFSFTFDFVTTIIRNDNREILFTLVSVSKTVIELSLALILIISFKMGWQGRLISLLTTGLLSGLFLFAYIRQKKQLVLHFTISHIKQIILFGLPTIPTYLMIFVLYNADKFMISQVTGNKEQVGIYSVAYQIAYLLQVFITAIYTAILPKIYDWMNENTTPSRIKIVKAFYGAFGLMIFAGIILLAISPLIYKYFINIKYHSSIGLLPFFIACYVIWTGHMFFIPIIYFLKKNKYLYGISITTIAISLISSYFAITKYGIIGACYSNLISFSFLTALFFVITQRIYRLPWLFFVGDKNYIGKIKY